MEETEIKKVFVSRANSYLNSHICCYLLAKRIPCVLGIDEELQESDCEHLKKICDSLNLTPEIRRVDYKKEDSVKNAIDGCDAFIHPLSQDNWYVPDDPVECYREPVATALMLLHCAFQKGIEKGIFSGSLVSVYGGRSESDIEVGDADWGEPHNMTPQARAYLYSERAVWAFNQQLSRPLRLAVLNLGVLVGPSLSPLEKHSSVKFMIKLLNESIHALLPLRIPVIDVRDAALVHVLLLLEGIKPDMRFNLCQGCYWLLEIAEIMRDEFSFLGIDIPSSTVGGLPASLSSFSDPKLKSVFHHCGRGLKISTFRIREVLSFRLRSLDEMLVDMGYHMIDGGLVKKELSPKFFAGKSTSSSSSH